MPGIGGASSGYVGNTLLAIGLVALAVTDAEAQDTARQIATPPASATDQANAAAPDPQTAPQFIDRDGKPLSPELQREAAREFAKNPPPPTPAPTPAPVQPDAPTTTASLRPPATNGEIVVTGTKPRGSVVGDIPPALSFNPIDIRAYGADDIQELLQVIGPQLASDRGREDSGPVVLLNGKRISSFLEIARIPTEAIERMEVFPEELALKYGYRADQKVVNIVTYRRFSSRIGQVSFTATTEGGRDTPGAGANYLRIAGDTRLNLDASYDRSGALLESERGIRQQPGAADLGRYRSLLPASDQLALAGTVSGTWLRGIASSVNAQFQDTDTRSFLGRSGTTTLARDLDTQVLHLGTSSAAPVGKWQLTFTANYDRTRTTTGTDTTTGRDDARAVNAVANADLLATGRLFDLPAGPLSASLRVEGETRDFDGRSTLAGIAQTMQLSRDRGGIQWSFDIPIASRRRQQLAWLGDLSANVNVALDRLSDFGTLRTIGYGITWTPLTRLNIIASATDEEGAPTVEQLGAPTVVTPNVRTFDVLRGETVDVTRVFGGNAGLVADDRSVAKLGINARPLAKTDLVLSLDYVRTRTDDPIAAFPILTPGIEAAFPDRFTRDADGRLRQVDVRALNFDRSRQQQMRWGLNFTRPLGPVPPGMQSGNAIFVGNAADLQSSLPPGARIVTPEPGSAAARAGQAASSRLILSLYYTLTLQDEIVTRPGGPVLDLLDGAATGPRGGSARHMVEAQASAFRSGIGGRVKAVWQSGSTVRGAGAAASGSGDLAFSDFAVVNANLFVNLADRFGGTAAPAWLKGTRVSLSVTNLFDRRPDVRDAAGLTPLVYQPGYLDPLGRTISLSLRKLL